MAWLFSLSWGRKVASSCLLAPCRAASSSTFFLRSCSQAVIQSQQASLERSVPNLFFTFFWCSSISFTIFSSSCSSLLFFSACSASSLFSFSFTISLYLFWMGRYPSKCCDFELIRGRPEHLLFSNLSFSSFSSLRSDSFFFRQSSCRAANSDGLPVCFILLSAISNFSVRARQEISSQGQPSSLDISRLRGLISEPPSRLSWSAVSSSAGSVLFLNKTGEVCLVSSSGSDFSSPFSDRGFFSSGHNSSVSTFYSMAGSSCSSSFSDSSRCQWFYYEFRWVDWRGCSSSAVRWFYSGMTVRGCGMSSSSLCSSSDGGMGCSVLASCSGGGCCWGRGGSGGANVFSKCWCMRSSTPSIGSVMARPINVYANQQLLCQTNTADIHHHFTCLNYDTTAEGTTAELPSLSSSRERELAIAVDGSVYTGMLLGFIVAVKTAFSYATVKAELNTGFIFSCRVTGKGDDWQTIDPTHWQVVPGIKLTDDVTPAGDPWREERRREEQLWQLLEVIDSGRLDPMTLTQTALRMSTLWLETMVVWGRHVPLEQVAPQVDVVVMIVGVVAKVFPVPQKELIPEQVVPEELAPPFRFTVPPLLAVDVVVVVDVVEVELVLPAEVPVPVAVVEPVLVLCTVVVVEVGAQVQELVRVYPLLHMHPLWSAVTSELSGQEQQPPQYSNRLGRHLHTPLSRYLLVPQVAEVWQHWLLTLTQPEMHWQALLVKVWYCPQEAMQLWRAALQVVPEGQVWQVPEMLQYPLLQTQPSPEKQLLLGQAVQLPEILQYPLVQAQALPVQQLLAGQAWQLPEMLQQPLEQTQALPVQQLLAGHVVTQLLVTDWQVVPEGHTPQALPIRQVPVLQTQPTPAEQVWFAAQRTHWLATTCPPKARQEVGDWQSVQGVPRQVREAVRLMEKQAVRRPLLPTATAPAQTNWPGMADVLKEQVQPWAVRAARSTRMQPKQISSMGWVVLVKAVVLICPRAESQVGGENCRLSWVALVRIPLSRISTAREDEEAGRVEAGRGMVRAQGWVRWQLARESAEERQFPRQKLFLLARMQVTVRAVQEGLLVMRVKRASWPLIWFLRLKSRGALQLQLERVCSPAVSWGLARAASMVRLKHWRVLEEVRVKVLVPVTSRSLLAEGVQSWAVTKAMATRARRKRFMVSYSQRLI